jgi:hypothetical protein
MIGSFVTKVVNGESVIVARLPLTSAPKIDIKINVRALECALILITESAARRSRPRLQGSSFFRPLGRSQPIEQVFAKLKRPVRTASERDVDAHRRCA